MLAVTVDYIIQTFGAQTDVYKLKFVNKKATPLCNNSGVADCVL